MNLLLLLFQNLVSSETLTEQWYITSATLQQPSAKEEEKMEQEKRKAPSTFCIRVKYYKETTLESAPCNESTTIVHAKKKELKHKGKMHKGEKNPGSYSSLPSIASNVW